jgi:LCP family protein required for cell wall assembly
MTRRSRTRARRTRLQRLLIAGNVVLIVVCLVVAGSLGYVYLKVRSIGRVELGNSLTPVTGAGHDHPENILIVGTDSAEGLDPKDPVLIGRPGGLRSDTIMILRLDPATDGAQILSLPRDLYVPIAGTRGSDRINAAIQGGPQRLIQTIKDDFGIPINHYIEMNFFAFRTIVAAVDGVPIYFPTPVRDTHSLLDIPKAGCITLDPAQALAFARSRDYEYFQDGRWHVDGTGDLGRISRQQEFIRLVIRRAIEKGARNPAVLNSLIDAGTGALHLDPTITPADLIDIGQRFKDFSPDNLVTYSVPVVAANKFGAAVLILKTQEAIPIFDLFRGVDANSPDSVLVIVQNGTTKSDIAGGVAADLRTVGFAIPAENVGDAGRFDYQQSTIFYLPGNEAKAQQLASYLVGPAEIKPALYLSNADVSLVIGADWQGVRSSPAPTVPIPDTTTTVPPKNARTSTTTTTTVSPKATTTTESTTTTIAGVVPSAPEDVHC